MYRFFCRVLALVFLVNSSVPAGWAQTARRSSDVRASRTLDAQVSRQVEQAQQANSPAAQFARADQQARAAHNERFAQADSLAQVSRQNQREAQLARAMSQDEWLVQRPNSLYVAPRVPAKQAVVASNQQAKTFLQKITNNEIAFEDLIEYADPMDPSPSANDLLTIAYAAEVIGNTVSEAMQLDDSQYDVQALQAQLVQIQARLLWRMALLGYEMPSYTAHAAKDPVSVSRMALNTPASIRKTMALASLRMALLKIHQFYQAKKLPDPADEYQQEMLVKKAAGMPGVLARQARFNDGLTARFPRTQQQVAQTQAAARKQAAQTVKTQGNLAVFMDQFISEFSQAIKDEPEPGTADYQHAQLRAEYATAYALEYDPSRLKKIVAIVDQGPKETDFKQDYSPILNAIFVNVFENTRYSTMGEAKTKQVLALLREFSDPQKYSLPTRVFALEAASLLYRPFNQDSFNNSQQQPLFAFFAPVNLNKPDENLRRVFAARVADLYCPLVSTYSRQMKNYGLDSSEMEALADKLGYMYDGFYDIQTQFIEDADKPASTHARANYPRTSCNITTHGNLNTLKRDNERATAVMLFFGEALFWVYGGELFSFLGTAFRLTRGAVAALPKAGRAFRVAANGERVAAFNNELRQGARFANWVGKNKRQQGYILEKVVQTAPARVEKEVVLENGVARTVEREIAAVTEYRPVNHTYQLEGKYSLWNPKRWFGLNRGEEVVGYRVTRMQPGLQTTVGEMRFGQPIDGLHSLQEVSQMTRQLQNVADGSRFWFEKQPYWRGMLNTNQAMQERWLLSGLESSFKNQVDLWIPLGETAQKAGKISETTRWWNVTQWGAPTKWGELVGEQMWGKAGIGGTSARMPIYVAPKTPLQFTWRGAANQLVTREEGIMNISEVLPGFYTSGMDVVNGNVYKQMFNAYMKPLNWEGTFAKTFLPDYVPTKAFWQSMKVNPVLGAQLAPQLLWRNRFVGTSAFFGAWLGADNLVYPPFKNWMEGQATKDANAEAAKYGDTFSPEQAKMDELLLQAMKVDLSDQRAMDTYNTVVASQKDQPDGTLITAPIIGVRRAFGMPFIGEDVKADYAIQAQRTDLNRALLHKRYNQFQAQRTQWQQEQRALIRQDEQKILQLYAQGLAAVPQLKKEIHQIYQAYEWEFLSSQTEQEGKQAIEHFNQQIGKVISQAAEWDNALKTAENLISQAEMLYGALPQLVTPALKDKIRQALRTYAAAASAAIAKEDEATRKQAENQLSKTLDGIWDELEEKYKALLTPSTVSYGVDFNPAAADK